MAVSSKSRLVAVPTIALMSLAVLSGCGSSDSKDASSSSSATSSSASAETSSATSSSASAETSSAAAPQAEATIPDGYKQVIAPKNKISFAVPEGWVELDSEAVANAEVLQEFLEQAASNTALTVDELKAQMAQFDLTAMATVPNADGFAENVNVQPSPLPLTAVPTADEMDMMVSSGGGTSEKYEVVDTPLGKGAKQSYSIEVAGINAKGVLLVVPSGDGSGFSVITISSSDTDGANALSDSVVASLSKAS